MYMRDKTIEANFFELNGQTIISIDIGVFSAVIKTTKNYYSIEHFQDCCEYVAHYKTIGYIENVLNCPITLAEEDNSPPKWANEVNIQSSHTWSAYFLETKKGRVEIWFLGTSNGYYSETTSFIKCE